MGIIISKDSKNYKNMYMNLDKINYLARSDNNIDKYVIHTANKYSANCQVILGLTDDINNTFTKYRNNQKYNNYNLLAVLYSTDNNDNNNDINKILFDIKKYHKIIGSGNTLYMLAKI